MGFFDLGRNEGFPSQYPSLKTPVTVDILEAGLILTFIFVAAAFLIVILGFSAKNSTRFAITISCSLTIGSCLILANFGQEWEVGSVYTKAPYRAGSPHQINATIGLKLGLRSVNVTLKGNPLPGTPLENETINYNERFWWTWDQGRFGFGPYAGLIQRSFREAQRKGLPIPILSVVEYFVIDGEGWRFGRFYRTAGWYTHILMWTAFATWILMNIFLNRVARYAAYYLALTGGLQIFSCTIWTFVRNPFPLVIPFESDTITTRYGFNYWMTLICGNICMLIAAVMLVMDLRFPHALSDFFGLDPIDDYDEYEFYDSEDQLQRRRTKINSIDMEMRRATGNYERLKNDGTMKLLRKRSLVKSAQKALFKRVVPIEQPKDTTDEDFIIYDRQSNLPGTSMQLEGGR